MQFCTTRTICLLARVGIKRNNLSCILITVFQVESGDLLLSNKLYIFPCSILLGLAFILNHLIFNCRIHLYCGTIIGTVYIFSEICKTHANLTPMFCVSIYIWKLLTILAYKNRLARNRAPTSPTQL